MFLHETNLWCEIRTDDFEKRLKKFVKEDKRRSLDLKHRSSRKVQDAANAEYDEAVFPAMSMKKRECVCKTKAIVDQWERSGKSNRTAQYCRAKLKPMVVPRDHAHFPVYRAALSLLGSR